MSIKKVIVFLVIYVSLSISNIAVSSGGVVNSVSDDWYVGIGLGESDHKYTLSDLEATGADSGESDFTGDSGKLFIGNKLSDNFSIEGGYVNLGKSKRKGSFSSGGNTDHTDGYDEYYGLNLVGVGVIPLNNRLDLLVKGGIFKWWNHHVNDISGSGQVFENQNDSNDKFDGTVFTYGVGLESDISKNISIRIDYEVFDDIFSDYIDNIDNGYIEKDIDLLSLNLVYHMNSNGQSWHSSDGGMSWYSGVMYGNSDNDARMSSGRYSGPIWNLKTNTQSGTVSGDMSDDKKSNIYKILLGYRVNPTYSLEGGYTDLGIIKSKSAVNGVTGGGNALTGSMTAQTDGFYLAGLLRKKVGRDFSAYLKGGGFYWDVDSEIYNNLDFNGVGGNRRGWIESDSGWSPLLGAGFDYSLSSAYTIRAEYERFYKVGTNDTTGEGDIDSVSMGLIYDF